MKYIFQKGLETRAPLLLLHGTGGNENDLLPIADIIDKEAPVLSVRGMVLEQGMPRFFKRLSEGVFDEEDLIFRTSELYDFLQKTGATYAFNPEELIAVGYSNGANIAASLLFHHKDSLKGAILFHPMVPRRGIELPDLTGVPVFIGAGRHDPICRSEETEELKVLLEEAGADVTVHWTEGGHELTQLELNAAVSWYNTSYLK